MIKQPDSSTGLININDGEALTSSKAERSCIETPPRNLDRSVWNKLSLVATDVFSILAWSGMSIYAIILWRYHGELVQKIPFSAEALLSFATP